MANPRDVKKIAITWTSNKSQAIKTDDFRNIEITAVGTGTIQVLASKDKNPADTPPDFTSPSTISNSYAAVVIADETVANTYSTSLTVSSSTKIGEVNTNLVTFICLTRSVDTVDAFVTITDNQ